jgi:hypothetical protein
LLNLDGIDALEQGESMANAGYAEFFEVIVMKIYKRIA